MRNAFADEITRLGASDPRVVLLSGDIGNKLFDKFKQQAQNRFYNCGVAEANMMSVAAGMALSGLRPVVYTITPFTTTRCLEQIRVDVCYHRAPVIIVGTGAGDEAHLALRKLMGKRARLLGTMLRARPLEEKGVAVDESLESRTVPGLYLAGDVTGQPLIRTAVTQGARA